MTVNLTETFNGSLLSDRQIEYLCTNTDTPMIHPFTPKLSEKGKISHGLSSYGYDATLAPKFKIARTQEETLSYSRMTRPFGLIDQSICLELDPKGNNDHLFREVEGDTVTIPPHGFLLGYTNEYFNIPEDVLSICLGKSTLARIGLIVNVTPLEPGWSGQVVIEISNTTPLPAKVYANEGICQFLFIKGSEKCLVPYNARGGKYMGQTGITMARILE